MSASLATINEIFRRTCSLERPGVMKRKSGEEWLDISVPDFETTVREISCGLRALGMKAGDRVAILSQNRPEWTQSDFAILAAGGVSVPVYPTLLAHQIEYILRDCGAVVVMLSDDEQLDKIDEIRSRLPSLMQVVRYDEGRASGDLLSLGALRERGREQYASEGEAVFERLLAQPGPDDLATLVYTSGTTGTPKGAMLTHGNIASNVTATLEVANLRYGEVALSILPLSHILERTADFAYLAAGCTVAHAEAVTKVGDNLREVQPDIFAAVPRLFEKMRTTILENVAAYPAIRQKIFHWALGVAEQRLPYRLSRGPMPPLLSLRSQVADRLVFSKIHDRLGGRVRFVLSGGAPLSAELAAFFIGAGIEICEGYGLTETSPVISLNTLDHRKLGSVGRPIPGVEVRIAEDGEILSRGPHIMRGYWNNEEATRAAIDPEGWFHTGDIGRIDEDGFVFITDRKKDIIVNSYGKNIAPQPLENALKTSPYIGTAVLIGDRRKYLVALIVPNFERLERELRDRGISFPSPIEMVEDPAVREIFQKEIDRFNEDTDRSEQVRRFTLLPRDFTVEAGEITPSMKVRRREVEEKYRELIDHMYEGEGE